MNRKLFLTTSSIVVAFGLIACGLLYPDNNWLRPQAAAPPQEQKVDEAQALYDSGDRSWQSDETIDSDLKENLEKVAELARESHPVIKYSDMPEGAPDQAWYIASQQMMYGAEVVNPQEIDRDHLPYRLLFFPANYKDYPALARIAYEITRDTGAWAGSKKFFQTKIVLEGSKWADELAKIHKNRFPCFCILGRDYVRYRDYKYLPTMLKVSGSRFPNGSDASRQLAAMSRGTLVAMNFSQYNDNTMYGGGHDFETTETYYGWRLSDKEQYDELTEYGGCCVPGRITSVRYGPWRTVSPVSFSPDVYIEETRRPFRRTKVVYVGNGEGGYDDTYPNQVDDHWRDTAPPMQFLGGLNPIAAGLIVLGALLATFIVVQAMRDSDR